MFIPSFKLNPDIMKKIVSIMALALLINTCESLGQSSYRPGLQKGSVLTSGNLALSFGTAKDNIIAQSGANESQSGYTSVTLSPKAGFFVVNGFLIGLGVDLNSMTLKSKDADSKTTITQFTAGPLIRYYAPGGFFVHADIAWGKDMEKYAAGGLSDEEDANVNKWQLGAGYAFFVNDHIAIEPNLIYRNSTTKRSNEFAEFKTSLGELVIGVGFSIFLHHKSN
jgi:outer membrane protein